MLSTSSKISVVTGHLKNNPEDASVVLIKSSPADLAEFIAKIEPEVIAESLSLLPSHLLADALQQLDRTQVSKIIVFLPPNLVSGILRQWMDEGKTELAEAVLEPLDKQITISIMALLNYPTNTVGSLMNTTPFTVPDNLTVRDVLRLIKKDSRNYSRYIHVVDAEGSLTGILSFKDAYYARKNTIISLLMTSPILSLPPEMMATKAFASPLWSKWHSLPVTTGKGRLIGVIPFDTLEAYVSKDKNVASQDEHLNQAGAAVGEIFQIGLSATATIFGLKEGKHPNG